MSDIRYATEADLPAIREIWEASFPQDTPDARDHFLSVVQLPTECVVAQRDGHPVSMGFFLPAQLHTPSGNCSLHYLYAASTLPAYRGRGIFADLLREVLSESKQRGIGASLLNPASLALVGYYRKLGYRPFAFCHMIEGIAVPSDMPIRQVTAAEFTGLREQLLVGNFIRWDKRMIGYAASYAVPICIGDHACALCEVRDQEVFILELLGAVRPETICAAIAYYFGRDRYRARIYASDGTCFGMLLPLSAEDFFAYEPPYMGLAFE